MYIRRVRSFSSVVSVWFFKGRDTKWSCRPLCGIKEDDDDDDEIVSYIYVRMLSYALYI
jgi:hypothetical protein